MLPLIMGILNVTPDSFSDGGQFCAKAQAIAHAEKMFKEGADIIDVGGESTRPGADPVSLQEELDRVLPVLEELVKWDVQISIDTSKSQVAKEALELGVDIVNDISALTFEEKIADYVAKYNAKLVLMHMRGRPKTMQNDLPKINMLSEVSLFLCAQAKKAEKCGVQKNNIILDPGIGFGKSLEDNIDLLRDIESLKSLGYPLLIGASRKSMINMISESDVSERLPGSLAIACLCAQRGADILRVHDVAETFQALKVAERLW